MIAFFDASALIYLLEGREPFSSKIKSELARLAKAHGNLGAAMSRLSWLECRVAPMKANDGAALAAYDAFFSRPDLVWIELSREVVELAATIRVATGIKTPDALQAASCLQLGEQHLFLSGDAAFKRIRGLNLRLLS